MAITFDSPITAVLGATTPARRKKFTDGLGLATVGDLLHHFPRRYLETGPRRGWRPRCAPRAPGCG